MKKYLIALLLVLPSFSFASPELIGGELASENEFKATILLGGSCTASKVGPKTFITAAHCVFDTYSGTLNTNYRPGWLFTVETHYGVKRYVTTEKAYPHETFVKEIQRRLQNGEATAGGGFVAFDIALINVVEETPEIEAAQLGFDRVLENETVVIGGYGCETTVLSPYDGGKYKIARANVVAASRVAADYYERDITKANDFNFYSEGKSLNANAGSICPGDSGGPAYRDSDKTVVGVNSQYIFSDESGISYVNTHTRVSEVADWARAIVK